jgi:uncharacterized membrane protein
VARRARAVHGLRMTAPSPMKPPPSLRDMSTTLSGNIAALRAREAEQAAAMPLAGRIADKVTRFTGSMTFVVLHLILFGGWIIANLGWIPGVTPFDETFVILAMWASVEAIFLSTFVLISQNRMGALAEGRADLDLHMGLLAEHELTKLSVVVAAIAEKIGVDSDADPDMAEVKRNVDPVAVMDAIEATKTD